MRSPQLTLAAAIAVVGLLALIAGIIYLTTPEGSLPSFFPGAVHVTNGVKTGYHTARGTAGIVFAVILWLVALALAIAGGRSRRRSGSRYRRYYR